MYKKISIPIILIISIIIVLIIFFFPKNNNREISSNINTIDVAENTKINSENEDKTENNKNKIENMDLIYMKINNQVFQVELEDNLATKTLKEKLKDEDVIIEAREYGGFEKVGDLGFSLPTEDTNITTSVGDIVLYQGNQISLFYNSNSWSYTKLGKLQNTSSNELKNILGNGDVTITLTLSR